MSEVSCEIKIGFYSDVMGVVQFYARSAEGETWYQCIGQYITGRKSVINVIASNSEEAAMYLDMVAIAIGFKNFTPLRLIGSVEGFDNSRHDIGQAQDNAQDNNATADTPRQQ